MDLFISPNFPLFYIILLSIAVNLKYLLSTCVSDSNYLLCSSYCCYCCPLMVDNWHKP